MLGHPIPGVLQVDPLEALYWSLEATIFRLGDAYYLELSHQDPENSARLPPIRGLAPLDLPELLQLQGQAEDYGVALARMLFAEPTLLERLGEVEVGVESRGHFLRLVISVDPTAQELHSLRWELLRHPRTGVVWATSERVVLSRLMVSRDWRPVQLRARSELVALVAVSAPVGPGFSARGLMDVDYHAELERIRPALTGMHLRLIGGPQAPLSLSSLVAALREGVDLLVLVAHGIFGRTNKKPALLLQEPGGDVEVVLVEDLATRVAELQRAPRLVVLASCGSAGQGEALAGRGSVQTTLAARLSDAGVPAVIAMQGDISHTTMAELLPTLFAELHKDGRIDRALAVARGVVRSRPDFWMPALFVRLLDGRLWYTPGFRNKDGAKIWQKLLPAARRGKLVPVLGPGLLASACGDSFAVARTLAAAHQFPLAAHEWDDLPRVSQYLSVTDSRYNVIRTYEERLVEEIRQIHGSRLPPEELPPRGGQPPDLHRLLGLVGTRLRAENPSDVHTLLAKLKASVYVTTNYDELLEEALRAGGRQPSTLNSRWRNGQSPEGPPTSVLPEAREGTPLVYHVFGLFGNDDSLVLTEDDYFDFLIGTAAEDLAPPEVEAALVDNALLFLGFRLTDWRFRVLFRLLRNLPGKDLMRRHCHVAVQMDPELQTMENVEGAREYLRRYFQNEAQIEIFFGSAEDFLGSLHAALAGPATMGTLR